MHPTARAEIGQNKVTFGECRTRSALDFVTRHGANERRAGAGITTKGIEMSINLKRLRKVRCRLLDRASGQPVAGIVVSLAIDVDQNGPRISVGTLKSDATGYVSFDLQHLLDLGLETAVSLLVTSPRVRLKDHDLLATTSKSSRTTEEGKKPYLLGAEAAESQYAAAPKPFCMEFPVHVDRPASGAKPDDDGCEAALLPSVQCPDLCDYELSPYSFVMPSKTHLGNGCCETLAPSSLPVQEHGFYRVIIRRKLDEADDSPVDTDISRAVDVAANLPTAAASIRFADVLEYRQRWYALGHSLGEIKYSLPLAPGESTQLAVMEWSRDDSASRFDSVRGTEYLQHDLRRDRSIDESVDAGLKESQGGWSWTGGLSSGMAYDAKAYGQYTGNWAAGGGTSNSWGQRDLLADSQQDLHDHVRQGTSMVRSLTSTVIMQATQAESNLIQTRRVANHNHCHALTIQYYEVLRHFRLRTEFLRDRKAVLIPFVPIGFTRNAALRFRSILEQVLLDLRLPGCFDALVRLNLAPGIYVLPTAPKPPVVDTSEEPDYFSGSKSVTVDSASSATSTGLLIEKGSKIFFSVSSAGIKFSGAPDAGTFGPQGATGAADANYPAPGKTQLALCGKIGTVVFEIGRGATINPTQEEGTLQLFFNDFAFTDNKGTASVDLTVTRPRKPTTVADPEGDVEAMEDAPKFSRRSDEICESRLLNHLRSNAGYYSRAVWILMDPGERRMYLEATLGADADLLSAIDDKPIAVSGNHVAFPYNGKLPDGIDASIDESEPEALESIVTLPTRGLFAEAQMGHCNSCEKRDITRMWNWTEMTVEEPPAIIGIQPGPQGQAPNLTPSPLPSNVIQITQPQAAPDPTALANALAVLGTPNIFRDMSGLDQASAILGKLVDGTNTTLAAMVKGASQAKGLIDSQRTTGTGSGTSGQQTPTQRYDNLQVAKEFADAADQLGLSEQQKNAISRQILSDSAQTNTQVAPDAVGGRIQDGQLVDSSTQTSPIASGIHGKALVGDATGNVDLSQTVVAYLGSLASAANGTCVAVSCMNFTNAMKSINVPFDIVQTSPDGSSPPVEMPTIATISGSHIVPRTLVTIWFSNPSADNWMSIPKWARGSGAPGALLYANLVENQALISSATGWPQGMKPGAHLQLWPTEAAFQDLRDSGTNPNIGHSCIFLGYVGGAPNRILIADQTAPSREVAYPLYGLRYIIAGNLSKAKLMTFP
jgi:hypothetical protein